MKVALPIDSKQGLGGGFSFARNLKEGFKRIGVEVVDSYLDADIVLICGVTMITKETFRAIKDAGRKVVVRLDNVPRNSRNRGAGTSRLKSYSAQADEVVWQSEWARFYLEDFIEREGKIIYNGVDTTIFTPNGTSFDFGSKGNVYLYSRYSRDETKMWETAWYKYQLIQRDNKDARLILIGKFSDETREYDFDFFRGEKYDYLGIIEDPREMAKLLRSCDYLLATYFNDAFANTYLEALCCGVELYEPDMSGGTPEMIKLFNEHGRDYFSLERMAEDYKKLFEEVLNG